MGKPIRVKLTEVFLLVSALVFAVNIYLFYIQNKAIRQIDGVYSHNIQLNDLSGALGGMQDALYQYLNTKSSDMMESYYTYEQDYREMMGQLNTGTVSEPDKLMEKNIYYMSEAYLEEASQAIEAKRGRNVSRYNEGYGRADEIYGYLQSCIHSTNNTVFLNNSHNYSLLRAKLGRMVWLSLALLLAVMLLAVAWVVAMTGRVTKPLKELADAANEIARGNMEVDFPEVVTEDEIGTVSKACNKMIESIRVHIQETKENYERENKLVEKELIMKNDLKEAQLKYLQAQINPHFLFNSLNAGAQLAMMEGAERACVFIENMADFFRYNVRKTEQDATLEEELRLVDNYIYILNVRFAGDIHYESRVDRRLLHTPMPSMIIQPLIENAVNHGIREMEGAGRICLSVYRKGDMACIQVEDNGKGIDAQIAEKILRGESAHSESGRDSAGIGMDNVISRLRRYYDMEHVIDIKRRKEGGTEVALYLKIPKGGTDDADFNL